MTALWAALLVATTGWGAVARLGPATPASVQAPAPVVTEVVLQLPSGSDRALLKDAPDLVALRRGQQLSKRAVRRSIERLFATGRFADVVVRAEPGEAGVRVTFELAPVRRIGAVLVEGNGVLSESEVRTASRLVANAEYNPERVEDAVQRVVELYRRRGYPRAKAESRIEPVGEGLDVTLSIQEGSPTRLSSITIAGGPGLPIQRLLEVLGLRVGDVLDRNVLEAGLDRLKAVYRDEHHYRARLAEPVVIEAGTKATLALPIFAGPRYELHFHGNRNVPDAILLGVLRYDGSEPLDRSIEDRLARRLAVYYRYQGYYDVRVSAREVRSPNQQRAILRFEIEEGHPLFVKEVLFTGNQEIPTAELRQLLTERVRALEPVPAGEAAALDDPLDIEGRTRSNHSTQVADPDPSTVLVEEAYRDAAEAMVELYQQRGYLSAKVALAAITIDVSARTASVRFGVEEGAQTVVQDVAYEGLPDGFPLAEVPRFPPGEPLSFAELEQSRLALNRALGRYGFLFARVDARTEVSGECTRAQVVLVTDPGPRVRVGKILLQGLSRTHEGTVRRALRVKEGDVLDPEQLFDTQRNLVLLGIFRTVAVRLIAPETVEHTKDVVIELRERPWQSGEVALGYFLAEGPRVVVDGVLPNIAGRAINLSARGKLNYFGASGPVLAGLGDTAELQGTGGIGWRANLSAQSAGLFPWDIGARVDFISERVHRATDRLTRFAFVPGLNWNPMKWLVLSLQWELENDAVEVFKGAGQLLPLIGRDNERLRFDPGLFTLHSLRFAPTIDLRDDPVSPRRGLLLALVGERTWDLGTAPTDVNGNPLAPFPIQTLKLWGTVSGYVPLGDRTVLALSLRGGRIFSLDPASRTIGPKRFYLGGASSLRGFREDAVLPADRRAAIAEEATACRALINDAGCTPAARQVMAGKELPPPGGELFTLAKSELRFPVFNAFDLALFLEAGNLWLAPERYRPLELRYTAGTGLRYATPIGPFALDVGFNLFPDVEVREPSVNVHFNIGLF